jgi:hypothetical protein
MNGEFTPVADDAPTEAAADEYSPSRGLWARLRAVFGGADAADRLAALDAAAAAHPDSAAPYLLRAELYARLGEDALALADFERAQTLAASRFERDNWGLVSQALRDRAAAGAADTTRRLMRAQGRQPAPPEGDE